MSEWTTDMMAFIPSQFGSCHFGWFRFCIFGDVKGLCVVGWAKLIYCLGRKMTGCHEVKRVGNKYMDSDEMWSFEVSLCFHNYPPTLVLLWYNC